MLVPWNVNQYESPESHIHTRERGRSWCRVRRENMGCDNQHKNKSGSCACTVGSGRTGRAPTNPFHLPMLHTLLIYMIAQLHLGRTEQGELMISKPSTTVQYCDLEGCCPTTPGAPACCAWQLCEWSLRWYQGWVTVNFVGNNSAYILSLVQWWSLGAASWGITIWSSPLNTPVKDIIILEPFSNEEVSEKLAKVWVVGLVIEVECLGVVQENAKLIGEPTAEKISGSCHLLFHDMIILLLLCCGLQALPWECSMKEIHEDVSKGLEIILASLLYT